jgi:hypothetical protein
MSGQFRQTVQGLAVAGNLTLWRLDGMVLMALLVAASALSSGLLERIK